MPLIGAARGVGLLQARLLLLAEPAIQNLKSEVCSGCILDNIEILQISFHAHMRIQKVQGERFLSNVWDRTQAPATKESIL